MEQRRAMGYVFQLSENLGATRKSKASITKRPS